MTDQELEKNLVAKHECYICLDICTTPSPCLCQTFVHKQCLKKYMDTQGKKQCAVCLTELPNIQDRYSLKTQVTLYITINVLASLLQLNYSWIDVPIFIVTATVTTLTLIVVKLLTHKNQCLVYKEHTGT